jgi:hypothetical protein
MAKMNRENKIREKRADKQAKKDARTLAALQPFAPSEPLASDEG